MSKKIIGIVVAMVVLTSLIVGCGGGDKKPTTASKKLSPITVVTAPMGSGWHAVSVLFSDIWMSKIPGLNVSVLEGGSVGNIKAIHAGLDANFGWAYTTDLNDAYKGIGVFNGKKYPKAKVIAVSYPVWLNIIALDTGKIKSVKDIIGKKARINAGAIGTGSELAAKRLLEAYGMTYESIKKAGGSVAFGNYSDAADQLKDGIVDIMMGGGAPEIPAIREVETQKKINLIAADGEELKKLADKNYGYTTKLPIPANTYKGQTQAVPAVAYQSVIIANQELPEDVVYLMTKHMWENIERLRKEQPSRGKYMTMENVFDGIDTKDLHPGAAKYYKEIGVLK